MEAIVEHNRGYGMAYNSEAKDRLTQSTIVEHS